MSGFCEHSVHVDMRTYCDEEMQTPRIYIDNKVSEPASSNVPEKTSYCDCCVDLVPACANAPFQCHLCHASMINSWVVDYRTDHHYCRFCLTDDILQDVYRSMLTASSDDIPVSTDPLLYLDAEGDLCANYGMVPKDNANPVLNMFLLTPDCFSDQGERVRSECLKQVLIVIQ